MKDLGEAPPELRALLDSERDVSTADRAAIKSRLATTLRTAPAPGIAAGKVIAIGVTAVIVAAAVWWGTRADPARPSRPAVEAPISVEAPTPVEVAPPPSAPALAPSATPVPPTTPVERARKPAPHAADEPSQAQLLAKAWQTLAHEDASVTLHLLDEDQRLHPAGSLAEERDAIRMKALVAASRGDEARALARTFLARYPHSVHRAAAQELAGAAP